MKNRNNILPIIIIALIFLLEIFVGVQIWQLNVMPLKYMALLIVIVIIFDFLLAVLLLAKKKKKQILPQENETGVPIKPLIQEFMITIVRTGQFGTEDLYGIRCTPDSNRSKVGLRSV